MAAKCRHLFGAALLLLVFSSFPGRVEGGIWHPSFATKRKTRPSRAQRSTQGRIGRRSRVSVANFEEESLMRGRNLLQSGDTAGADSDGDPKKNPEAKGGELGQAQNVSRASEANGAAKEGNSTSSGPAASANSTNIAGSETSTSEEGGSEAGPTNSAASTAGSESPESTSGAPGGKLLPGGSGDGTEKGSGEGKSKRVKKLKKSKSSKSKSSKSKTSRKESDSSKGDSGPMTPEDMLAAEAAKAEEEAENQGPTTRRQRIAHLQSLKEQTADTYAKMKRKLKYLQKSVQLKQSQNQASDSQAELDEDEISATNRQLKTIKESEEKANEKYTSLKSRTKELAVKALVLTKETDKMSDETATMTVRLNQLSMDQVLANSARGLPDSVAGAIRRSAEALTPFVDTLMVAADTNQRLVDHVGAEIDKYTHVNIRKSPFLSGILFYCVLLIPTLTIVSFVRRLVDSSSQLTVSHFIIFGNVYFIGICLVAVLCMVALKQDPAVALYKHHENVFATFNVLLSVYYAWHLCMLGLQSLYTRERRDFAQLVATVCVGIHYFVFTWRRVFTNSAPHMLAANYLLYCTIFVSITIERVRRIHMTMSIARHFRSGSDPGTNLKRNFELCFSLAKDIFAGVGAMIGIQISRDASKSSWYKDKRGDKRLVPRSAHSEDDIDMLDEERGENKWDSRRPHSARYPQSMGTRHKRRPVPRSPPAPARKGFASMFFGTPDEETVGNRSDEDDDDDEERSDEDNTGQGWWDTIARVTGHRAATGSGRPRQNGSARTRRGGLASERTHSRPLRRTD